MKAYCIFAVNRKNRGDVLGLAEYSFCNSWSRDWVRVFYPAGDREDTPALKYAARIAKLNPRALDAFKGRHKEWRRRICSPKSKYYHAYGRTRNEELWLSTKNLALRVTAPPGYDIVLCRANSSHCPATVDIAAFERVLHGRVPLEKLTSVDVRNTQFRVNL